MTPCEIAGEKLVLLAERAAFWPARRTLFVADFHLGKAASFRHAGIPLPSGTTTENVERLGSALDRTRRATSSSSAISSTARKGARRARSSASRRGGSSASRSRSRSCAATTTRRRAIRRANGTWRASRRASRSGPSCSTTSRDRARRGYALAGHIHPAVRLSASGEASLRLPCFWFAARCGVLPAFGAFTGSAVVRPRAGDQVFVIAEREVLQVA